MLRRSRRFDLDAHRHAFDGTGQLRHGTVRVHHDQKVKLECLHVDAYAKTVNAFYCENLVFPLGEDACEFFCLGDSCISRCPFEEIWRQGAPVLGDGNAGNKRENKRGQSRCGA